MGQLSWAAGWGRIRRREKGVSGRASFSHLPTSKDKNLPPVRWGWSFPLDKWGAWGGPQELGNSERQLSHLPFPFYSSIPMRRAYLGC